MCPILVAHYEAKSVWKDIANSPPDLVLSVGTGRNIGDSSKSELKSPISLYTATNDSLTTSNPPSAVIRQGRGGMGNYKRQSPPGSTVSDPHSPKNAARGYIVRNPQAPMLLTFNNPISGQTDRLNDPRISERIWNSFLSSYVPQETSIRQRYRRVCPELFSKIPKFDDVSKLEDLERETQGVLRHSTDELVEIAHRLVASTFFFEKDVGSLKQKASEFTCTGSSLFHLCPIVTSLLLRAASLRIVSGSIFCRFRPGSPEIKALAWFLISLLDGDFEPYFLLEEECDDDAAVSYPVTNDIITFNPRYSCVLLSRESF